MSMLKKLLGKKADTLYKNMTLGVFLILPSRVSNIFISLSILALIYRIKNLDFTEDKIDRDKFNRLLKISFNEEVLLLPTYTLDWFWDDAFLNTEVNLDQKKITLRDAINNNEIFVKHIRGLVDTLLNHIPPTIKYKLKFNEAQNRIAIKHNIMNFLLYSE